MAPVAPVAPRAAFVPPATPFAFFDQGNFLHAPPGCFNPGTSASFPLQTHPSFRLQFPTTPPFGTAAPAFPVAQPTYLPQSLITRDTSCNQAPVAPVAPPVTPITYFGQGNFPHAPFGCFNPGTSAFPHPPFRSQFPTSPAFGAPGPAYPAAQPAYLPRSSNTRDTSRNQVLTANVLPLTPANRKRPYPLELGEASGDVGQAAKRSKPSIETPARRKDSLTQKIERSARQQAREAKKQAWALGQNYNSPTDEPVFQNQPVVAPAELIPNDNLEMATGNSTLPEEPGYVFVPAGDMYITLHCKKWTKAVGKPVYAVRQGDKQLGIQVPESIHASVLKLEASTRAARQDAASRVDPKEKAEARECLLRLYPHAPAGDVEAILCRAWQRNSGRVGRTSEISLERKTHLAVQAHARHCHSSYEHRIDEECRKQGVLRISGEPLREIRRQSNLEALVVLNSWRGPQVSTQEIPPRTPEAAQVALALAPIRYSESSSVEHPAPEQIAYQELPQIRRETRAARREAEARREAKLARRKAAEERPEAKAQRQKIPKIERIALQKIKTVERKKQIALEAIQSLADGYKRETKKQRKLRTARIQDHLRSLVPKGESKVAQRVRRRREMRVIEEMLKEPVDGFILETHKERKRRIRRAQAKGVGKKSGAPGDSSIELRSATAVQSIIISDGDSGHRGSPVEPPNNGGDHKEWSDYEDGSSAQVGEDEDSEYIASDAEGGGDEGGGEVKVEQGLTEVEGGEEEEGKEMWGGEEGHEGEYWYEMGEGGEEEVEGVEEGVGSGEVIVEIDDDIGEEIAGGGSDEPPQAGWYFDMVGSLVGNPRNEAIETEPPATEPTDSKTRQMELKSLQSFAARWRVVRNPPQQA